MTITCIGRLLVKQVEKPVGGERGQGHRCGVGEALGGCGPNGNNNRIPPSVFLKCPPIKSFGCDSHSRTGSRGLTAIRDRILVLKIRCKKVVKHLKGDSLEADSIPQQVPLLSACGCAAGWGTDK